MEHTTTTSAAAPVAGSGQQMVLSDPQIRALEWLTTGGSITEAAQFAGVARQTVTRWLKDDQDFKEIYDGWREQIMTMAEGQMFSLAEAATATIAGAIRDKRDVKAAQFVMKQLIDMNRARKTNGR